MPVNHSLKIVFVHIPKTAGTSIEFALGMHSGINEIGLVYQKHIEQNNNTLFGMGLQHLTAYKIMKSLGEELYSSYYKFSVIRNPYDRLVSYVAWINAKWERKELLTREVFKEYIRMNFFLGFSRNRILIPQYNYLYYNGKVLVDKILYFENIINDFSNLAQELNLEINLEKRMTSYHEDFLYYYGNKEKKIIKDYYKKDFRYFGFE
jgi:hypothetical protein